MDFLKDGVEGTEGITIGSVMGGLEFSVETGSGKSQDGEADSSGEEGFSKGLEVEVGNSGLGIG